ncbi:phage tail tube protein [Caminicella sporogenes]|uniref:phage tail tube protein n=1 Tax=Caminicella sporogenes TaxID=166485 RepID=UPI0025419789|nr:phage tail tube protein [Caminicella sporogenes]WIF95122.1 phage tail tube protein [Caminicella sporogenes]
MAKGNKYWTGNKGRVWINDIKYANCYKAEMKRTNNYEEIPDPEGNGMVQVFTGYSITGSVTMRKQGNEEILKELKEDKNGELEISLIIKEENPYTGQIERVKYTGVTVDEFPLSQYENRAITEIELSLKARDYEVLQ